MCAICCELVYMYVCTSLSCRGNLISMDLYFESMSITEMNQNKAMDMTALLSKYASHN